MTQQYNPTRVMMLLVDLQMTRDTHRVLYQYWRALRLTRDTHRVLYQYWRALRLTRDTHTVLYQYHPA
jgi:hypothetical protein